ncbi:glycogen phosphorylase [Arboricoccus pini]|uniref:Alpha-1,4 glucan phosphorylase n=1 Tax=Arboricoccus pini TaxID=1963835 RepID=A0A212R370_9PROT|nr:glycogen/starch/alpha-glucan phosphorylase [Arboricoccus pini]SNB66484.1 glycogen phosphorylase [Arboricoccus pini]
MSIASKPIDPAALKSAILDKLVYSVGKDLDRATRHDWFFATTLAVRDRIVDHWMQTHREQAGDGHKHVYYLSLEFLIGRLLADALNNMQLMEPVGIALSELGVDPDEVLKVEPDAALGNGGLGRLAACFMDSMATLGVAGMGYGIRYEHGLFKQGFDSGWQVERPEDWLAFGNPWEFERPEAVYPIRFFGTVKESEIEGRKIYLWEGGERVLAVAWDTPIVGWQGQTINTLRLWSGQSGNLIDLDAFNRGDYVKAVEEQVNAQSISRVLYPNDSTEAGQLLRLKQEYFFTSASLQDILRRHLARFETFDNLGQQVAIQLNDTHPAIAVPELMRLLIDDYEIAWDKAFAITSSVINYTNHTLMPEALERWPVSLMERLLPRHMQIIYELNAQVLNELRSKPETRDPDLAEVSIIGEGRDRMVRMGNLAFLGSRRVNGVSALHGDLMKETVFKQLHAFYPQKITAITNGVTPRRWLLSCNPGLAALITSAIGDRWITDLEALDELTPLAKDASFKEHFARIKRSNKEVLAALIAKRNGIGVDPDALFDVQIKRIHEYKRQLLNILEAIALYLAIKQRPDADWQPRVKIFGGKAAPSYVRAKLVIKLINDVARVVNGDPDIDGKLRIAFLPNYNVSLAERIIPAGELSEQISTAGLEASGTGNMKFALNGALTIGTLDGANVEIKDHVGDDNIFIFGLTAEQVLERRSHGHNPQSTIETTPILREALDAIGQGRFSVDNPSLFRPLLEDLRTTDWFLVTDDFKSYFDTQRRVDKVYADQSIWTEKAIINTAKMGFFSSDRSIREYADVIWQAPLAH